MDCKQMLQSTFDWAKKGAVGGAVEFPDIATVYATVTLHQSLDRPEKTSDVVWYANGALSLNTKDGQEMLAGNIQAWVNQTDTIFVPSETGNDLGSYDYDLFPNSTTKGLLLKVNKTGMITIGKLIKGKLIGGMPPTTFQATCENGLLTGTVNVLGDCVCTVSFSLGTRVGY
ncbi:hypothetical protein AMR41_21165 [Hapalosiphon sp. MRB220]|nr:hypothetical protein AMR41_21165 [Hapalosiphon sp. MRB220]